ncbi:MAG: hypothetical protein ACREV0_11195 [Burkholderiales bacterium]
MKAIFSIVLFLALGGALAAEKHSQAEVLLFETNHLQQIKEPEVLFYSYKKKGSLETGFEDQVKINIDRVKPDGFKAVSSEYLTGDNHQKFAPLEQAAGNPVLLFFLERDIHEMQRLTKGHWRYFQKRIRTALADEAEVRPLKFLYNGKEASGHEIKITPYVSAPEKARYEKFANKLYVFALSDSVPGGVYQIRTVVSAAADAEPLMEETLTFAREQKK